MRTRTALLLTMLYFTNGMCSDPSVKGYTGESVIIGCKHNRTGPFHKTIYFCKFLLGGKNCDTKMERTSGSGWQHDGRLSSFDQEGTGVIKVVLNNLTTEDTGLYWCSDLSDRDNHYDSVKVQLNVTQQKPEREGTCKLTGYVGHNITLSCSFDKSDQRSKTTYLCKNETDHGCINGATSNTRIAYDNATGSGIIANLTAEDSGTYWCVVEFSTQKVTGARFKVIELDVKPGPLPNARRNGSIQPMALHPTPCFRPKPLTPTHSVAPSAAHRPTTSSGHGSGSRLIEITERESEDKGDDMAIPLSLSLLAMGLVIFGMAVFICRRVRRNRRIEKNPVRETTAEESHPVCVVSN
ncbi:polymeric immunoglobulin receptor-like [Engraulis encrasicolus]|uniref:polymeric immunoglobulin receptor-like n=1 Tax=Engraulis encrasicolus TaxID=184585 RepID=UPI002FD27206